MSNLQKENFVLKKFKNTKQGMNVEFYKNVVLEGGAVEEQLINISLSSAPHPDLLEAFDALSEIVKYDESYPKKVEMNMTGITIFPKAGVVILSHVKEILSGKTVRNSGRISYESESFEKAEVLKGYVDYLEEEVFKFLFEGKRAQLSLALEEEGAEA